MFSALSIAAAAIVAGQPVFWPLPPRFLTGARAAAGFAAINSVGNLGGLIAQPTVPAIHDRTGSNLAPMLFLAVCLAATAIARKSVVLGKSVSVRVDLGGRRFFKTSKI